MIFPPVDLGGQVWDFSRTCVFGVVNVTPDSFFDGGRYADPRAAVDHAQALLAAGAHVLDVGGESTRPGADPVPADDELARVLPVVEGIRERCGDAALVSVDTYKAAVARAAVAAGAKIINDISGLKLDPDMARAAADTGALLILGHLRGEPRTMGRTILFTDVVAEVIAELRERVRLALAAGVAADRIWVDPGIGFGKTADQSLALLRATGTIREAVGYPILVGPSRKSFIGAVTGQPAEERLMGTCAAVSAVVLAGADAVRIHDVQALAPAVAVADAIRRRGM